MYADLTEGMTFDERKAFDNMLSAPTQQEVVATARSYAEAYEARKKAGLKKEAPDWYVKGEVPK